MSMIDPLQVALVERTYVSNFGTAIIGIQTHIGGVLADVDGPVAVSILNEASEEVYAGVANHPSVGTYDIALSSSETAVPGLYLVYWEYTVGGVAKSEESYVEVGQRAPLYDSLTDGVREIVEQVYLRFADLYDSPIGGPHLQVYVQTNWGRERMAQLLRTGMARLNVVAQPHQTYSLTPGVGQEFPVDSWGGLLEQLTYIEVLKHLQRSYVEQPDVLGVNVARLDRRDYMNRWGEILRDEKADLEDMIDNFKMAHMGLGHTRALVAGGVYGRLGHMRHIGLIAHRPAYIPKYY